MGQVRELHAWAGLPVLGRFRDEGRSAAAHVNAAGYNRVVGSPSVLVPCLCQEGASCLQQFGNAEVKDTKVPTFFLPRAAAH